MNREVKVRAWDTQAHDWVEGITLVIHTSGRLLRVPSHIILTWSTGLKDRHGKEIFEGDICRMQNGYPARSSYEVYWDDDRWGLRDKDGGDYDNGDYYHGDVINWQEAEIIGNLYENGDLLK